MKMLPVLVTLLLSFYSFSEEDSPSLSPEVKANLEKINERITPMVHKVVNQIPDLDKNQQDAMVKTMGKLFFKQMLTRGKMMKLRKEGGSRKDMMTLRNEMKSIRDTQMKEAKAILNKEQFKQLKKAMEEFSPGQPGGRGGNRPVGGGRGMGGGGGRGQS